MEQERRLPKFESEAEEARWWFENQELLAADFERAAAEGRLGRGTAARRASRADDALVLEPEDAQRARVQAERRGLEYQAYLKMVVHRALLLEEKSA